MPLSLPPTLHDAEKLLQTGQARQALILLDALRKKPATHAGVFCLMAQSFQHLSMHDAAEEIAQQGLKRFPDDPGLINQLANSCYLSGQYEKGLAWLKPLLAKGRVKEGPDLAALLITHAALLNASGNVDAAREVYARVLAHDPEHALALNNLGSLELDARHYDRAIVLLESALQKNPQQGLSRIHLAHAFFRSGDLAQGWQAYQERFSGNGGKVTARGFPQTPWQGETLSKGQLLIWNEQGVGEEILYATLLPDALERCPKLILECDARLIPLIERNHPAIQCVARKNPPDARLFTPAIEAQCAAGNLGGFFRNRFEDFPAFPKAWKADAEKTAQLRARYESWKKTRGLDGKIIGVSWRSKPMVQSDAKSTNLSAWDPVFANNRHLFIHLQFEASDTELRAAQERGWALMDDPDINQKQSLDDFAAQIAAMDAVVTVSNTTAHLTGILQKRGCVLLPHSRGLMWHWFDARATSPWYPSLALLRQSQDGVWGDVIMKAVTFLSE